MLRSGYTTLDCAISVVALTNLLESEFLSPDAAQQLLAHIAVSNDPGFQRMARCLANR